MAGLKPKNCVNIICCLFS